MCQASARGNANLPSAPLMVTAGSAFSGPRSDSVNGRDVSRSTGMPVSWSQTITKAPTIGRPWASTTLPSMSTAGASGVRPEWPRAGVRVWGRRLACSGSAFGPNPTPSPARGRRRAARTGLPERARRRQVRARQSQ